MLVSYPSQRAHDILMLLSSPLNDDPGWIASGRILVRVPDHRDDGALLVNVLINQQDS